MRTRDRLLRAAFVSLALGIAWAIRGDYGGLMGVGYCGAVLAMGFAYVSGQRAMFRWMPLIAAIAALAFVYPRAYYEPFHAYACNKTFVNYSYGLLMLVLQGGGWGCFACCFIGLMLEKEQLKASEWASLLATVLVSGFLFYYVLVDLVGIHVTPGPLRNDKLIGVTASVIALFVWLIVNKKPYGLKGLFFGYIGFGLGMAGGRFLANVRDYSTWTIGDWNVLHGLFMRFENVMEILVGLIAGFIFTYGMLGKKAPEFPEDKHYKLLSVYSIFFVLAGIPILHRLLAMAPDFVVYWSGYTKGYMWTEVFARLNYAEPGALAAKIPGQISLVCVIAVIGAVFWLYLHLRNKHRFAAFPILCLSAVMIVIQNIDHQYLFYPLSQASGKMWLFPGMFLLMVLYVIFGKRPEIAEADEVAERVKWKRWLVGAVIAYAVMVVLSGPVNANQERSPDEMRFPAGGVTPLPWGYRPPEPKGL